MNGRGEGGLKFLPRLPRKKTGDRNDNTESIEKTQTGGEERYPGPGKVGQNCLMQTMGHEEKDRGGGGKKDIYVG